MQKNLFKLYRIANDGYGIQRRKHFDGTFQWKDNFDCRIVMWRLLSLFTDRTGFLKRVGKILVWKGPTEEVGLTSFRPYNKKYIWKRKCFDGIFTATFENRSVPVPEQYDVILKKQFGNYMQFVKGAALHSIPILDLDTPYEQKLKDIFGR